VGESAEIRLQTSALAEKSCALYQKDYAQASESWILDGFSAFLSLSDMFGADYRDNQLRITFVTGSMAHPWPQILTQHPVAAFKVIHS